MGARPKHRSTNGALAARAALPDLADLHGGIPFHTVMPPAE
jgi:hypothetical protein